MFLLYLNYGTTKYNNLMIKENFLTFGKKKKKD